MLISIILMSIIILKLIILMSIKNNTRNLACDSKRQKINGYQKGTGYINFWNFHLME